MSLLSIICLVIAVLAFTSLPGHTVSTMVHSCALCAVTYSSKTMFFSLTSFWCFFSKPVFQVIDPLYLCHPGIVNCLGMVEPQCMTPNSLRKYFNYIECSSLSVQAKGNYNTLAVSDGISKQLQVGTRLWHVKPDSSHYTNNPIV